MDSNHVLHAVFRPLTHYLTILVTTGGITDPPPGIYTYVNGTDVTVTAIPDAGFSFNYWLLDGEKRTENIIALLMNASRSLQAFFVDDIPPEIGDPIQDPRENVQPFQNVTVTVDVTDLGRGVCNVTLWYSIDNETTWMPLNMTEISPNTYQATIPGYENCTWIEYKILAYDNAGNNATKDDNGYSYKYHVIPEFPSTITLSLFMLTTLITIILLKREKSKTLNP